MIDSWDWVLRSFECRVQWSAVYAESNSILSRRFVYNRRSTYPFGRLSHFLNYTFLLEVSGAVTSLAVTGTLGLAGGTTEIFSRKSSMSLRLFQSHLDRSEALGLCQKF